MSHIDLKAHGDPPVAPSAVSSHGHSFLKGEFVPVSSARETTVAEIKKAGEEFRKAAERAFAAEVDSAEIHGANGYLLDQFLQGGSNCRVDAHGGSIGSHAPLLMKVTKAVVSIWGQGRVGFRIGTSSSFKLMSAPVWTFCRMKQSQRSLNMNARWRCMTTNSSHCVTSHV